MVCADFASPEAFPHLGNSLAADNAFSHSHKDEAMDQNRYVERHLWHQPPRDVTLPLGVSVGKQLACLLIKVLWMPKRYKL